MQDFRDMIIDFLLKNNELHCLFSFFNYPQLKSNYCFFTLTINYYKKAAYESNSIICLVNKI